MKNNELAGIGHNNPPLSEVLHDETAALRQRAADLAASAGRCAVTDQDTAERATTLAKMIKAHIRALDDARTERKQPFLDAGRTVDGFFGAISQPLKAAESSVVAQIDAYRREVERKAAEERRRQEEEARRLREQAEAAERARRQAELKAEQEAAEAARKVREAEETARRAGDLAAQAEARRQAEEQARADAERREAALRAEIEARRLQDEADAAATAAATVAVAPIVSEYGAKAGGRKVKVYAVTDAQKLGLWLLRNNPDALTEALLNLAEPIAKGMKLPSGSTAIPGLEITEEIKTVIR